MLIVSCSSSELTSPRRTVLQYISNNLSFANFCRILLVSICSHHAFPHQRSVYHSHCSRTFVFGGFGWAEAIFVFYCENLLTRIASFRLVVPIESRQVGDLQCNIDRLSIVAALAKTVSDVKTVASAGSGYALNFLPGHFCLSLTFNTCSDPAVTSATTAAQGGLSSATQGIETIAGALLTGKTAPADARTQVQDGLTTASTALSSINS